MANISSIKLPSGNTYTLKDNGALQLTGGSVTGPVSFGNSVTIDELTTGSLIVNGNASFVNGVDAAQLTGTVPTGCLPSYVDDVLEYAAKANFPSTGETGKIYVDKTTNLTWRWGGSSYVEISPSLAIGKTSSTAAAGNHTHSVTITPTKTDVYSMTSAGSVTAGTAPSFTRGTFTQGSLTMTINGTDSNQLDIVFTKPTHAADTFNAGTTPSTVVLPGRSSKIEAWTGYSGATANAQT